MREDNLSYFERRLAQEEEASARAADAISAAIHRELAKQYRALAEAERRPTVPGNDSVIRIEAISDPNRN